MGWLPAYSKYKYSLFSTMVTGANDAVFVLSIDGYGDDLLRMLIVEIQQIISVKHVIRHRITRSTGHLSAITI